MPQNPWSQVCEAYEESLDIFEVARDEYDKACRTLVEKASGVMTPLLLVVPDGFSLGSPSSTRERENRAGQWIAKCELVTRSPTVSFFLTARMAAPWDGPPRTMRLGLSADVHWLLLPKAEALLGSDRKVVRATVPDAADTHWIRFENVDDEDDGQRHLQAKLDRRRREAVPYFERVLSVLGPACKGLDALIDSWHLLRDDPTIGSLERSPANKPGVANSPWAGMGYIQLYSKPASIWVGLRPTSCELIYAHERHPEKPDLDRELAKRIGAVPMELNGEPAGVIANSSQIEAERREQLRDRCFAVYKCFAELVL